RPPLAPVPVEPLLAGGGRAVRTGHSRPGTGHTPLKDTGSPWAPGPVTLSSSVTAARSTSCAVCGRCAVAITVHSFPRPSYVDRRLPSVRGGATVPVIRTAPRRPALPGLRPRVPGPGVLTGGGLVSGDVARRPRR